MTIFLTSIVSILVFAAGSFIGVIWFHSCVWDELWRGRNFRILAVVLPITFFLAFAIIGDPPEPPPACAPVPCQKVEAPKKKAKIKKKIKQEEDDSSVEIPVRIVDPSQFEENHD